MKDKKDVMRLIEDMVLGEWCDVLGRPGNQTDRNVPRRQAVKEQKAKKKLVMVDPGHGGPDPGAVARSVREKDLTLIAAMILADELADEGVDARLTRTRDFFVPLVERAHEANRLGADAFISIHANAAMSESAHGFEVWTSPGYTAADPWATRILNAVANRFPDLHIRRDHGDSGPDKEAHFTVLTRTVMPAVLVEMGFLTNAGDRARLVNTQWIRLLMRVIAQTTADWLADLEAPQ